MSEVLSSRRLYNRRKKIAAVVAVCALNLGISSCAVTAEAPVQTQVIPPIDFEQNPVRVTTEQALRSLGNLAITGRAPRTGYDRNKFGSGWLEVDGCDTRNLILKRDLDGIVFNSVKCEVISGELTDPYSGNIMPFVRGEGTSSLVQIDHVVALSNAWQMSPPEFRSNTKDAFAARVQFANDPLNLRAVEGKLNSAKGDGDAATWLPPNKAFRCEYVADQTVVKEKYDLRVTQAEHDAILRILNTCPDEVFELPN